VKVWIASRRGEIRKVSRHQVVEPHNFEPLRKQAVDEVRAEKSSGSSHKNGTACRSKSHGVFAPSAPNDRALLFGDDTKTSAMRARF
jgi:hypothetical protein